MKKILSILTVLCLVLLMPTAVLADGDRDPGVYTTAPNGYAYTAPQVEDNTQYLYDFAGIIPDDEEPALREKLASTADRRDCALLVVTTDKTDTDPDYGTAVTRAYAEDFYEANAEGLSEDAWILCIDMNNRVIMTVGYGRFAKEKYVAFTEEVYDDVVGFASEGAYSRVVETFASDVYKLDNWSYAMIPTVGSLMISLAAMVVVLSIYNGFEKLSEQRTSRMDPPLMVERADGRVIGNADSLAAEIAKIGGVDAAFPTLSLIHI